MSYVYPSGMEALKRTFGRFVPEGSRQVVPIHNVVPGRVRLHVAALRSAEALRRRLEAQLRNSGLVQSAVGNVLTGTILVIFPRCRSCDEIVALVESFVIEYSSSSVGALQLGASPESRTEVVRSDQGTSWHASSAEQVLATLATTRAGLTSKQAEQRLRRLGPNSLPALPRRSSLEIALGQFTGLPVALLAASAAVSLSVGGVLDALVIGAVVLANAVIGFVTESQSERTIAALENNSYRHAQVVRDGASLKLNAEELVPGDILLLAPGCYVCADARLLQARDMTVDESALTGESLPVAKHASDSLAEITPLAERTNMVHMGCGITSGSGIAVVVGTASETEIGRIQSLVSETRPPQTPMQRQLDRLGRQLVWISSAICAAVFGIGWLRGLGLLPMLRASISLAVAAVPEGLPTVATTTLALSIRAMQKHNILVRHLDAIETLGAVQIMCLDKTGTLTANRMSVLAVHVGGRRVNVRQHRFSCDGSRIDPLANDDLMRLLQIAVLCNETEISGPAGAYSLNGSSTESALMRLAIEAGVDVDQLRQLNPRAITEYRTENRSYMRTLHETAEQQRLVAVKGSPVEVLNLCRWYLEQGVAHALTDEYRARILGENDRMAGEALRVLGIAYTTDAYDLEHCNGDLTWVGLVGMADPIRDGMAELIGHFHRAGIKTAMITGDQSATAYAIGRQLRLSGEDDLRVIESTRLEGAETQAISDLAQTDVFSRVSPAQKLGIVQCLQSTGKVVAMTGDGINDGPALRAADIGVAMGGSGTDVARSVADVIIEDDNLQTMMAAIAEGRTSYDNTRKAVHFLVSSNLSEIWLTLVSVTAGFGSPLSPMQLLWINLITDVFPGLALAAEPPEPEVLLRPPRDPDEAIMHKSDLKQYGLESCLLATGGLAAYGYGRLRYGAGARAGTLAFMSLGLSQLAHTYTCRSDRHGLFVGEALPRNNYLNGAIGISVFFHLATAFVPWLRALLGTTPLSAMDLAVTAGTAMAPYLVNEGVKARTNNDRGDRTLLVRTDDPVGPANDVG